jgi:Lanthionine synthetase C-like protein
VDLWQLLQLPRKSRSREKKKNISYTSIADCCKKLKPFSTDSLYRLENLYNTPEVLESPATPDELLYGRAGCLYSLLFIKQHGGKVNEDLISALAHAIVRSGRKLAEELKQKNSSTPPLMYEWHGKKYLAAAHGVAGILYLLLQASLIY